MNLILFLSGLLVLLSVLCKSEAQKPDSIYKKCYKAKTCVHNNHEKCGINGNNERRRFLDSCDIEEFNCLYDKDYKKTSMDTCHDLPSLYARVGKERDDGDQLLQNNPDKLENENNPNILNMGPHNAIEYADSSMPAQPQNLNQPESNELLRGGKGSGGQMKMVGNNGTKNLREAVNETFHGKKTKKPFNVSKIPVKMAKLVKYKTTMEDKTLRQRKE